MPPCCPDLSADSLALTTFPSSELPWIFCSSCSIVTWQEIKSFLGRTAKRDRLSLLTQFIWPSVSSCHLLRSIQGRAGARSRLCESLQWCCLRHWPSSFTLSVCPVWKASQGRPQPCLPGASVDTWQSSVCRAGPATQPRWEGIEPESLYPEYTHSRLLFKGLGSISGSHFCGHSLRSSADTHDRLQNGVQPWEKQYPEFWVTQFFHVAEVH